MTKDERSTPPRRRGWGIRRAAAHALLLATLALAVGLAGALPFEAVAQSETPTPIPDPSQAAGSDSAAPPVSPATTTSRDAQLAVGQTAAFEGGALQVTLLRVVEDSRCPSNVMCVWAGRAVVMVDVTVDGVPRGEQKLTLFPTRRVPAPSPDMDATVDRYVLTLAGLQPYPVAGQPQRLEERIATIQVTVSP